DVFCAIHESDISRSQRVRFRRDLLIVTSRQRKATFSVLRISCYFHFSNASASSCAVSRLKFYLAPHLWCPRRIHEWSETRYNCQRVKTAINC
ncbi:hypothetical protein BDZ89DRAFT_1062782, partial [Hymenopellis radicata]